MAARNTSHFSDSTAQKDTDSVESVAKDTHSVSKRCDYHVRVATHCNSRGLGVTLSPHT